MESARFSESDAAYRLLQQHTTREHNLFERPILARLERSALLEPLALRVLPPLPALRLSERYGMRQLIPFGRSGQRATSVSTTFALRRCKHADG
jgi:hypothetical protein